MTSLSINNDNDPEQMKDCISLDSDNRRSTISIASPSRPTSHNHHGNSNNNHNEQDDATGNSPSKKEFRYIKPRIGSAFQINMLPTPYPKLTSSSPSPVPSESNQSDKQRNTNNESSLNDDISYTVTKKKKGVGRPSKKNKSQTTVKPIPSSGSLTSLIGGATIDTAYTDESTSEKLSQLEVELENYNTTSRGGLCVHRPSNLDNNMTKSSPSYCQQQQQQQGISHHDHFLTFTRNLILQTPHKSSIRINHLWKSNYNNALFVNNKSTNASSSTENIGNNGIPVKKKRGRKRKTDVILPEDDDVPFGSHVKAMSSKSSFSDDTQSDSTTLKKQVSTASSINMEPSQDDQNSGGMMDTSFTMQTCDYDNVGLEDDEFMLKYLQMEHNGDIDRAEIVTLASLCMGKGKKTRKFQKKMRKAEEIAIPLAAVLSPLSESWRRRYERVCSNIVGDHRRKLGSSCYPYYHVEKMTSTDGCLDGFPWSHCNKVEKVCNDDQIMKEEMSSRSRHKNSELTGENYLQTWKILLEHGQNLLRQIESDHENKPCLNDLIILICKAYSIPKPEELFGRRDSISKHISTCMNSILDHIDAARDVIADLVDLMHDEKGEGIDLNSIKKIIESFQISLHVEEIAIIREMLNESILWESKLGSMTCEVFNDANSEDLQIPQQSLLSAVEHSLQGRVLSLRPKSLVTLEERIQRAYNLRGQILQWSMNEREEDDHVKNIAYMIKEANSINLGFPELSVLSKAHRDAEEWFDRATIALRSKISLRELESLVKSGENMPAGMCGLLEKLKSRYENACDWVSELKEEVPCPLESISQSGTELDAGNRAEWLLRMINTLQNGDDDQSTSIIELSAEGTRLPVDIDFLQLLQVAIDFRNWSLKAKRWVPNSSNETSRRGKIDDLRDHLDSSDSIRLRAKLLTDGKSDYEPEYEKELHEIVEAADDWYEKNRSYIEGDNRRLQGRCSISYTTLKGIVDDANSIYANLGNSCVKMNRIFSQAQTWMTQNGKLLKQCRLNLPPDVINLITLENELGPCSLDEIKAAVESADKDLSVDLNEVKELGVIAERAQEWFKRASQLAPKRNKRIVRGKKGSTPKHALEEFVSLIEEATALPVDTGFQENLLKVQLSEVQSWRLKSQSKFREIASTFKVLREERIKFYGLPEAFIKTMSSDMYTHDDSGMYNDPDDCSMNLDDDIDSHSDEKSISVDSEPKASVKISDRIGEGRKVYKMVASLSYSAEVVPILSTEEKIAEQLVDVTSWCRKAANLIGSTHLVFVEKSSIKELETLIKKGADILSCRDKFSAAAEECFDDKSLYINLTNSWSTLVLDDLARLESLKTEHDNYLKWCENVKEILSEEEKNIKLATFKTLVDESQMYPQNAEVVKQVRLQYEQAIEWVTNFNVFLNENKKIPLEEAKIKLDEATKLRFSCTEKIKLRNAVKDATSWLKRVKKINANEGLAEIAVIKSLIKEHEDLSLICFGEELNSLKGAICGYCICRRPYEGFMIGCDECDEWYHGSCLGVSETRAQKYDKFLCVRCNVNKVYQTSCKCVVSVIRKWSDDAVLQKARFSDNQKLQRKIRDKNREIASLQEILNEYISELEKIKNDSTANTTAVDDVGNNSFVAEIVDSQPSEIVEKKEIDIEKVHKSLHDCNEKLIELERLSIEKQQIESEENKSKDSLRYWCALIRSKVIAPDNISQGDQSRPKPPLICTAREDLISQSMHEVLEEAKEHDISKLPDFTRVEHSFYCIGWCMLAFSVLRKRPKIEEFSTLIQLGGLIKLPDTKSISVMRSIISRIALWQIKVSKCLSPIIGRSDAFDTTLVKELHVGLLSVPIITPEELLLLSVIADDCRRHCTCGGPKTHFMVTCQHCQKSFHSKCIGVNNNNTSWICPSCNITQIETSQVTRMEVEQLEGTVDTEDDDVSTHAPDPLKVWPPFGLNNSSQAICVMGVPIIPDPPSISPCNNDTKIIPTEEPKLESNTETNNEAGLDETVAMDKTSSLYNKSEDFSNDR